jgi:RNA polymerase sigma-70 factor, ECF subfamily
MTSRSSVQIMAAKAGDRDAIEAVVRRVGRIALPLAIAVLHDREVAGEVAQDVAVDVVHGLQQLRDPERFDAWIRRIAVRKTLRAARSTRGRLRVEIPLDNIIGSSREPTTESEQTFVFHDELRAALAALPPRQRLALVLRYAQGLSDNEIAEALGCRPGTAASLLSRARAALRQQPFYAESVSVGCS